MRLLEILLGKSLSSLRISPDTRAQFGWRPIPGLASAGPEVRLSKSGAYPWPGRSSTTSHSWVRLFATGSWIRDSTIVGEGSETLSQDYLDAVELRNRCAEGPDESQFRVASRMLQGTPDGMLPSFALASAPQVAGSCR